MSSADPDAAFAFRDEMPRSRFRELVSRLWVADAWAATCPGLSACSSGQTSFVFGASGCQITPTGATWTGSLVFNVGGSTGPGPTLCGCANAAQGFMQMPSGCSVTRTVGDHTVRTNSNGASVTIDTATASGWEASISGGTLILCTGSNCAAERTVNIQGIHYTGQSGGKTVWDHTVSTPTRLVVRGVGAARVVKAGGVVAVQHNAARFTSITTVLSDLTHSAGCCFPTGGSVSTAFRNGGILDHKTETLAFKATCGDASFTGADGTTRDIHLTRCM